MPDDIAQLFFQAHYNPALARVLERAVRFGALPRREGMPDTKTPDARTGAARPSPPPWREAVLDELLRRATFDEVIAVTVTDRDGHTMKLTLSDEGCAAVEGLGMKLVCGLRDSGRVTFALMALLLELRRLIDARR